jgi:thiamine pyrophosphate-dependent acetolactate synthase large subunit-like protein
MPTLAHALLAALKDHGAHEIFGIPGDFVLPLFKVIEESNILPNFTLSHEPAVIRGGRVGALSRRPRRCGCDLRRRRL